jgi:20S proteasome alpha/beta subunit
MTLQVGLVAKNGFVLASDRKAVRNFRKLPPVEGRTRLNTSSKITKILVSTNGKLVCAFSGSDASAAVARRLIDSCPEKFDTDAQVEEYLRKASQKNGGERPDNELVIAAIPGAQGVGRLWRILFSPSPVVQLIHDKIYGGEETNPAVYLTERYYQESLSVNELASLAVHFILEGHRLSSSTVGGLDVFVSEDGNESRFLSDDEKKHLEAAWLC